MEEVDKNSRFSLLAPLKEIFAIDLRSLALFRIIFAAVLLFDLYYRACDLEFFYTDNGAWPRSEQTRTAPPGMYSLHLANGTWEFQALLFLAAAVSHICLLLGYRTRIAVTVSWILTLSLNRRNMQILQGGDDLVRALSFWALFLPLAARWSLDERQGRVRDSRTHEVSLPSAMILAQVVFVYLFTSVLKWGPAWRLEGTAIAYALKLDQFTKPFGYFLLNYPHLLTIMTFAVVNLETYGALLVLSPIRNALCRIIAVALFVSFHFGLFLSMELGHFPYVCISAWLLFIPSTVWDAFPRFRKKEEGPMPTHEGAQSRAWGGLKALVLLFFFVNLLCWNIRTTNFKFWQQWYPTSYNFINQSVGLDQYWAMFAPYPLMTDGWYVIKGQTQSGRTVNFSPSAQPDDPVTDEKPLRVSRTFPNERWRKYLMNLTINENSWWRPLFTAALARRWNAKNPDDPIRTIDFYRWTESTRLSGEEPREKRLLWHYESTGK